MNHLSYCDLEVVPTFSARRVYSRAAFFTQFYSIPWFCRLFTDCTVQVQLNVLQQQGGKGDQ